MIPISSPICLFCRTRFDDLPLYCPNQVSIAGGWERTCPGPVVQVFVTDPDPATQPLELAA